MKEESIVRMNSKASTGIAQYMLLLLYTTEVLTFFFNAKVVWQIYLSLMASNCSEKCSFFSSFQEVTISDFFSIKSTWNHLSESGWNKKETKRKRLYQEAIVTTGASKLFLQTKITYSDLLKRPQLFS